MGMYPLILRPLTRQRKQPVSGQVFTFSNAESTFWFGRVIRTDVPMMGGHVSLAYLYSAQSASAERLPLLSKESMLGPPELLGSRAWRQGFLKLGPVQALTEEDFLAQHVFYNPFWKKFFDVGKNDFVPDPGVRCGIYGSGSAGSVNAALCKHLGIEMVPWPDGT